MIRERVTSIFWYIVFGAIILFLLIHLFQDPVGAAHVVSSIVGGIGTGLSKIWTFFSTLWTSLGG